MALRFHSDGPVDRTNDGDGDSIKFFPIQPGTMDFFAKIRQGQHTQPSAALNSDDHDQGKGISSDVKWGPIPRGMNFFSQTSSSRSSPYP